VDIRLAWLRRLLRFVAPVAIGLLGAWVGMLAWGRANVVIGPFHVQLASTFGPGRTQIALPPFGQLVADTHRAPLRLTATLENVDVPSLTNRLRTGSLEDLAAYGESDQWSWKALKATYCYDLHATILHLLGIDHERLTFRNNGANRRLTDVHGSVISEILAA